jgi:hypothetical protein
MAKQVQQIDSIGALVAVVEDWEARHPAPGEGFPAVWYHGQDDAAYELTPGVLRATFLKDLMTVRDARKREAAGIERERAINAQFSRMGASLFPQNTSLVSRYLMAQH